MNESEFRALIEQSWRRPLTDEEQIQVNAWLALHPEDRLAWEEEAALNRAIETLADAPVSSNFTALVMDAVQRKTRSQRSGEVSPVERIRSLWRRLAWPVATALLVALAAVLGYRQHQLNQIKLRQEVATGLSVLANVASVDTLSDPAVFQDFDAIQRLGQTSSEDEELYAVLSQ